MEDEINQHGIDIDMVEEAEGSGEDEEEGQATMEKDDEPQHEEHKTE